MNVEAITFPARTKGLLALFTRARSITQRYGMTAAKMDRFNLNLLADALDFSTKWESSSAA